MLEHVKCETPDLAKANLEKLKALFPGVVTEGPDGVSIDVEALKQECSATPIEGNVERYAFTWPGKRAAKAAASASTTKTLRPCREESVNFDTTENLYIEGDNLEVLKLLQTSYAGKIKMIYIDPPYNTGHDFVYRDRFSLTDKELATRGDQCSDDEKWNVDHPELNDAAAARYHSNWCSMMYPRLKLARQLLRDDGFLFMSLDDNESHNARKLLDEIFGAVSFIADICHKARASISNDKIVSANHNHVLWVCKDRETAELHRKEIGLDPDLSGFDRNDNDGCGAYRLVPVDGPGGARKGNPYYEFLGVKQYFRFSRETMEHMYTNGLIIKNGDSLQQKYFLSKAKLSRKTDTTWWDDAGLTSSSTAALKTLMGGGFFDNPKPISLVERMLTLVTHFDPEAIILDFFSGSATTAHAVMQLNAEDGGNRKFIMVQLPEPCAEDSEAAKAGYKNICEIGKERIRRAGKKLLAQRRGGAENGGMGNGGMGNGVGDDLFASQNLCGSAPLRENDNLDIGFRVLKLDSSSLNDTSATVSETTQEFANFDRIKSDRSSEDLLFQVLLETHIPLSDKIVRCEVGGNEVLFVGLADALESAPPTDAPLLACLDAKAKMTTDFFIEIAKLKPGIAFFRDDAFADDSARTNLQQSFEQFSPSTAIKVI